MEPPKEEASSNTGPPALHSPGPPQASPSKSQSRSPGIWGTVKSLWSGNSHPVEVDEEESETGAGNSDYEDVPPEDITRAHSGLSDASGYTTPPDVAAQFYTPRDPALGEGSYLDGSEHDAAAVMAAEKQAETRVAGNLASAAAKASKLQSAGDVGVKRAQPVAGSDSVDLPAVTTAPVQPFSKFADSAVPEPSAPKTAAGEGGRAVHEQGPQALTAATGGAAKTGVLGGSKADAARAASMDSEISFAAGVGKAPGADRHSMDSDVISLQAGIAGGTQSASSAALEDDATSPLAAGPGASNAVEASGDSSFTLAKPTSATNTASAVKSAGAAAMPEASVASAMGIRDQASFTLPKPVATTGSSVAAAAPEGYTPLKNTGGQSEQAPAYTLTEAAADKAIDEQSEPLLSAGVRRTSSGSGKLMFASHPVPDGTGSTESSPDKPIRVPASSAAVPVDPAFDPFSLQQRTAGTAAIRDIKAAAAAAEGSASGAVLQTAMLDRDEAPAAAEPTSDHAATSVAKAADEKSVAATAPVPTSPFAAKDGKQQAASGLTQFSAAADSQIATKSPSAIAEELKALSSGSSIDTAGSGAVGSPSSSSTAQDTLASHQPPIDSTNSAARVLEGAGGLGLAGVRPVRTKPIKTMPVARRSASPTTHIVDGLLQNVVEERLTPKSSGDARTLESLNSEASTAGKAGASASSASESTATSKLAGERDAAAGTAGGSSKDKVSASSSAAGRPVTKELQMESVTATRTHSGGLPLGDRTNAGTGTPPGSPVAGTLQTRNRSLLKAVEGAQLEEASTSSELKLVRPGTPEARISRNELARTPPVGAADKPTGAAAKSAGAASAEQPSQSTAAWLGEKAAQAGTAVQDTAASLAAGTAGLAIAAKDKVGTAQTSQGAEGLRPVTEEGQTSGSSTGHDSGSSLAADTAGPAVAAKDKVVGTAGTTEAAEGLRPVTEEGLTNAATAIKDTAASLAAGTASLVIAAKDMVVGTAGTSEAAEGLRPVTEEGLTGVPSVQDTAATGTASLTGAARDKVAGGAPAIRPAEQEGLGSTTSRAAGSGPDAAPAAQQSTAGWVGEKAANAAAAAKDTAMAAAAAATGLAASTKDLAVGGAASGKPAEGAAYAVPEGAGSSTSRTADLSTESVHAPSESTTGWVGEKAADAATAIKDSGASAAASMAGLAASAKDQVLGLTSTSTAPVTGEVREAEGAPTSTGLGNTTGAAGNAGVTDTSEPKTGALPYSASIPTGSATAQQQQQQQHMVAAASNKSLSGSDVSASDLDAAPPALQAEAVREREPAIEYEGAVVPAGLQIARAEEYEGAMVPAEVHPTAPPAARTDTRINRPMVVVPSVAEPQTAQFSPLSRGLHSPKSLPSPTLAAATAPTPVLSPLTSRLVAPVQDLEREVSRNYHQSTAPVLSPMSAGLAARKQAHLAIASPTASQLASPTSTTVAASQFSPLTKSLSNVKERALAGPNFADERVDQSDVQYELSRSPKQLVEARLLPAGHASVTHGTDQASSRSLAPPSTLSAGAPSFSPLTSYLSKGKERNFAAERRDNHDVVYERPSSPARLAGSSEARSTLSSEEAAVEPSAMRTSHVGVPVAAAAAVFSPLAKGPVAVGLTPLSSHLSGKANFAHERLDNQDVQYEETSSPAVPEHPGATYPKYIIPPSEVPVGYENAAITHPASAATLAAASSPQTRSLGSPEPAGSSSYTSGSSWTGSPAQDNTAFSPLGSGIRSMLPQQSANVTPYETPYESPAKSVQAEPAVSDSLEQPGSHAQGLYYDTTTALSKEPLPEAAPGYDGIGISETAGLSEAAAERAGKLKPSADLEAGTPAEGFGRVSVAGDRGPSLGDSQPDSAILDEKLDEVQPAAAAAPAAATKAGSDKLDDIDLTPGIDANLGASGGHPGLSTAADIKHASAIAADTGLGVKQPKVAVPVPKEHARSSPAVAPDAPPPAPHWESPAAVFEAGLGEGGDNAFQEAAVAAQGTQPADTSSLGGADVVPAVTSTQEGPTWDFEEGRGKGSALVAQPAASNIDSQAADKPNSKHADSPDTATKAAGPKAGGPLAEPKESYGTLAMPVAALGLPADSGELMEGLDTLSPTKRASMDQASRSAAGMLAGVSSGRTAQAAAAPSAVAPNPAQKQPAGDTSSLKGTAKEPSGAPSADDTDREAKEALEEEAAIDAAAGAATIPEQAEESASDASAAKTAAIDALTNGQQAGPSTGATQATAHATGEAINQATAHLEGSVSPAAGHAAQRAPQPVGGYAAEVAVRPVGPKSMDTAAFQGNADASGLAANNPAAQRAGEADSSKSAADEKHEGANNKSVLSWGLGALGAAGAALGITAASSAAKDQAGDRAGTDSSAGAASAQQAQHGSGVLDADAPGKGFQADSSAVQLPLSESLKEGISDAATVDHAAQGGDEADSFEDAVPVSASNKDLASAADVSTEPVTAANEAIASAADVSPAAGAMPVTASNTDIAAAADVAALPAAATVPASSKDIMSAADMSAQEHRAHHSNAADLSNSPEQEAYSLGATDAGAADSAEAVKDGTATEASTLSALAPGDAADTGKTGAAEEMEHSEEEREDASRTGLVAAALGSAAAVSAGVGAVFGKLTGKTAPQEPAAQLDAAQHSAQASPRAGSAQASPRGDAGAKSPRSFAGALLSAVGLGSLASPGKAAEDVEAEEPQAAATKEAAAVAAVDDATAKTKVEAAAQGLDKACVESNIDKSAQALKAVAAGKEQEATALAASLPAAAEVLPSVPGAASTVQASQTVIAAVDHSSAAVKAAAAAKGVPEPVIESVVDKAAANLKAGATAGGALAGGSQVATEAGITSMADSAAAVKTEGGAGSHNTAKQPAVGAISSLQARSAEEVLQTERSLASDVAQQGSAHGSVSSMSSPSVTSAPSQAKETAEWGRVEPLLAGKVATDSMAGSSKVESAAPPKADKAPEFGQMEPLLADKEANDGAATSSKTATAAPKVGTDGTAANSQLDTAVPPNAEKAPKFGQMEPLLADKVVNDSTAGSSKVETSTHESPKSLDANPFAAAAGVPGGAPASSTAQPAAVDPVTSRPGHDVEYEAVQEPHAGAPVTAAATATAAGSAGRPAPGQQADAAPEAEGSHTQKAASHASPLPAAETSNTAVQAPEGDQRMDGPEAAGSDGLQPPRRTRVAMPSPFATHAARQSAGVPLTEEEGLSYYDKYIDKAVDRSTARQSKNASKEALKTTAAGAGTPASSTSAKPAADVASSSTAAAEPGSLQAQAEKPAAGPARQAQEKAPAAPEPSLVAAEEVPVKPEAAAASEAPARAAQPKGSKINEAADSKADGGVAAEQRLGAATAMDTTVANGMKPEPQARPAPPADAARGGGCFACFRPKTAK